MPNHIKNRVWFEGDPVDVWHAIQYLAGDGEVDFNRVIPMPDALHGDVSCSAVAEAKGERVFGHESNDAKVVARLRQNIEDHGYAYWYDFACAKWGTKWNAYSQSREPREVDLEDARASADRMASTGIPRARSLEKVLLFNDALDRVGSIDDVLLFETAWSTPLPIFEAVAAANPDVTLVAEYADEDLGSNCGTIRIHAGLGETTHCELSGANAYRFAYRLHGGGPSENAGDYVEEDEEFEILDGEAGAYDDAWFRAISRGWEHAHWFARVTVLDARDKTAAE